MSIETTVRVGMPLIDAQQASQDVTHNEALFALDALLGLSVPSIVSPSNTPGTATNGLTYLTGAAATGAWSGHNSVIAYYMDAWYFYTPFAGMLAYAVDTAEIYNYTGSAWVSAGGAGKQSTSEKDQPSGYAGLDSSGNLVGTIVVRSGTASGLAAVVLATGQPGYATDTKKFVIGDGVTTFANLPQEAAHVKTLTVDDLELYGTKGYHTVTISGTTTSTTGVTIFTLDLSGITAPTNGWIKVRGLCYASGGKYGYFEQTRHFVYTVAATTPDVYTVGTDLSNHQGSDTTVLIISSATDVMTVVVQGIAATTHQWRLTIEYQISK